MKYFLSDIDFDEKESAAVADVMRSKWLSAGPRTEEFENRFARDFDTKYAVAVANCTAALHLSLKACGIGPGDEVLLPSYTFVATANAVLYQGATPVFVDIEGVHDLNLNIKDLESKITSRTAAIMPVHLCGYAADMDAIMSIAKRHGLCVIEDACHAIGATYRSMRENSYNRRKLGTIGDTGCFSFFANKNLVTGEGGMIVTNDEFVATKARRARSHGMTKSSWDKASGRATDYDIFELGYNYRCTDITAAIGLVQLDKLLRNNAIRRAHTRQYQANLASCPDLDVPFIDRFDDDSGYHIFPIVLKDANVRPLFRKILQENGVQTSIHYPPVHMFTQYQRPSSPYNNLDMTVDVSAREVTLPLHPLLSEDDINRICEIVVRALRTL